MKAEKRKVVQLPHWIVIERDSGYVYGTTLSYRRAEAIAQFDKDHRRVGTSYERQRRFGNVLAVRLYVDASAFKEDDK